MENKEKVGVEKAFTLPSSKKIMIVPVRRKGGWLPPEHEGSFLFKHSYVRLIVPMNERTGDLLDPLTIKEREFFESDKAGLALKKGDLLIHNKEATFWPEFQIKLDKHLTQLDLSDPMDYLTYKVLLVNKRLVAPSNAEKFNKASYKFVIVEEGYQNETRVKAASSKKEAYKFMGKIDSSKQAMRDFLNVYNTQKPGGKSVPPNATESFLIAELDRLVEDNLTDFLGLARDKNYEKKVLIFNAMKARALVREGMTFKTPEGVVIGENLNAVISWMNDDANNEEVIKIKGRIDNSK